MGQNVLDGCHHDGDDNHGIKEAEENQQGVENISHAPIT